MRAESYKLAVLVMRAQGMHDGHGHILEQLEGEFDGTLILVGSSYRPRSWKNPFTFAERRSFIAAGTRHIDMNIDAMPLLDTLYNDRAWLRMFALQCASTCVTRGLTPRPPKSS